jgi:Ca-activated chloride channel family protein
MEAQDFISSTGLTSRMEGVKRVTNDFLRNRAGDRIGVVLFGSHAYLQSPLTLDHDFLRTLLVDIRPGVAGDGTAIGDGIGTALKHIQALPADTRAIILLTDGVNTSGNVEPMKAARIAAELGIRIYTIGIGSQSGSFLPSIRGLPLSQQISAAFDESALRRIADVSGGVYYFASNEDELNNIYREIESLETAETETTPPPVTIQEIAPPLLWVILAIFLIHLFLSQTVLRVLP